MHLFSMENRDEFLRKAKNNALTYIGVAINITVATITREAFDVNRLGKYKDDEAITSLAEFRCVTALAPSPRVASSPGPADRPHGCDRR